MSRVGGLGFRVYEFRVHGLEFSGVRFQVAVRKYGPYEDHATLHNALHWPFTHPMHPPKTLQLKP